MYGEESIKKSLVLRKSPPSGVFCMSGPVAHVDDDEEVLWLMLMMMRKSKNFV